MQKLLHTAVPDLKEQVGSAKPDQFENSSKNQPPSLADAAAYCGIRITKHGQLANYDNWPNLSMQFYMTMDVVSPPFMAKRLVEDGCEELQHLRGHPELAISVETLPTGSGTRLVFSPKMRATILQI